MSLKLYYAPGACSLAPHVVLEWIGQPYEAIRVQYGSPELLKLNPSGAVPVLDTGEGWTLTQAGAVLHHLARRFPEAKLGADGNPEKDANGRFIKADLRQYAVMRKEPGWGAEYPADKKNGDWEYRIFTKDHVWNDKVPAGVCLDCHLPKAGQDFVWSYDDLKKAH